MGNDREYYRRRLEEELHQAATADRIDVRSVHEKLARMYQERIRALDGRSSRSVPLGDCSPAIQPTARVGA